MCSDYEKSLVQPIYETDALGPRALPETHPLLQDWQVKGYACSALPYCLDYLDGSPVSLLCL